MYLAMKKNVEIFFFEKTQNNDLFISPKWKKTILEMAIRCQKVETRLPDIFSKLLADLIG